MHQQKTFGNHRRFPTSAKGGHNDSAREDDLALYLRSLQPGRIYNVEALRSQCRDEDMFADMDGKVAQTRDPRKKYISVEGILPQSPTTSTSTDEGIQFHGDEKFSERSISTECKWGSASNPSVEECWSSAFQKAIPRTPDLTLSSIGTDEFMQGATQSQYHLNMYGQGMGNILYNEADDIDRSRQSRFGYSGAGMRLDETTSSVGSTLVLNCKTRRVERKTDAQILLNRRRGETGGRIQPQGQKEVEQLAMLWEAFNLSCTDKSGLLKTKDFKWTVSHDRRVIELFGLETEKNSTHKNSWVNWIASKITNQNEAVTFVPESEEKYQAIVSQIRRVESDLISRERVLEDPKMTFKTFSLSFSKFIGFTDPFIWRKSYNGFVELAREKDNPYSLSATELMAQDAVLGFNISKNELRLPGNMTLPTIRLIEPPNYTVRQECSEVDEQRKRETLQHLRYEKSGFYQSITQRLELDARRVELSKLTEEVRRKADLAFAAERKTDKKNCHCVSEAIRKEAHNYRTVRFTDHDNNE